jgi:hypothetical protein
MYALRAKTRWLARTQRERHCGTWAVDDVNHHPYVEVHRQPDGSGRARWCGLLKCGHVWTCPVCALNLLAKKSEKLSAGVRGLGGRWQMLTVTLRHRDGVPLRVTLAALLKAWRRCRQGGRVQGLWSEYVTGSVRATEITHGNGGWHPHLHVLLRTPEWPSEAKQELLEAFQRAIRAELGQSFVPNDDHALTWSDAFDATDSPERARYLSKMGLELASTKVTRSSITPWDIARAAAAGDQAAMRLWSEYYDATRGRRRCELDVRASDAAKAQLIEDAGEREVSGVIEPPLRIEVKRDEVRELRALERRHPTIFADVLTGAEQTGSSEVRAWIAYAQRPRPPPCQTPTTSPQSNST